MSDNLIKEIRKERENLARLTKIFKEWGDALEKQNKDQNKNQNFNETSLKLTKNN